MTRVQTPGGIDSINRRAWEGRSTLKWFHGYEGWSDPGEQAAVDFIRSNVIGKRILDIGVGAGRTVPLLLAVSEDYRAIDFAQLMVDTCKQKHPEVDVRFGDARNLDEFADDSIDFVNFSWNGIDAVDNAGRAAILAEAHRVLTDGGIFLFSAHNQHGPGWRERPWRVSVHPRRLVHPRDFARSLGSLPIDLWNYPRHRREEIDGSGWAIRRCAAHHYGLVIRYTTLEQQISELGDAGFENLATFENATGARVVPGQDTTDSWWFHFVAMKRS